MNGKSAGAAVSFRKIARSRIDLAIHNWKRTPTDVAAEYGVTP
jgi:hypothetical protein